MGERDRGLHAKPCILSTNVPANDVQDNGARFVEIAPDDRSSIGGVVRSDPDATAVHVESRVARIAIAPDDVTAGPIDGQAARLA